MLDISPNVEQAIIAQAEQQGVTVNQYLSNMVFQEPFLDSDMVNLTLTDEQAEFVNNMLENPKPLSDTAKAFLRGL